MYKPVFFITFSLGRSQEGAGGQLPPQNFTLPPEIISVKRHF